VSVGTVVQHRRWGIGQVIAHANNGLGDVVVRFAATVATTHPNYLNTVRSYG